MRGYAAFGIEQNTFIAQLAVLALGPTMIRKL